MIARFLGLVCLCIWGGAASGHGKLKHVEKAADELQEEPSNLGKKLYSINENYVARVKPIFRRACFDCHSSQVDRPWYYALPGVKQLIDRDIAEAHKHLDIDKDFPFTGHGSPESDLEAIRGSVLSGSMPPWSYRLMHREATLTAIETELILRWIDESLVTLDSAESNQIDP